MSRFALAVPVGSALAVGVLLLLSWMITPSLPLAAPDNRVVLNLTAWPTPITSKVTTTPNHPKPIPPRSKKRVRMKTPTPRRPTPTSRTVVPAAVTPPPINTPDESSLPPTAVVEATHLDEKVPLKDTVLIAVPLFELTALPRFIHQVQPHFPESMRHLAREGVVELDVLIDFTGRVRHITVIQSAGPEFDQAVHTAILASTFAPGEVNGKPVTTLLRLPVKFRLQ